MFEYPLELLSRKRSAIVCRPFGGQGEAVIKSQELRPEKRRGLLDGVSPLVRSKAENKLRATRALTLPLRGSEFLATGRGVRNKTERGTSEDLIPSMLALSGLCWAGLSVVVVVVEGA